MCSWILVHILHLNLHWEEKYIYYLINMLFWCFIFYAYLITYNRVDMLMVKFQKMMQSSLNFKAHPPPLTLNDIVHSDEDVKVGFPLNKYRGFHKTTLGSGFLYSFPFYPLNSNMVWLFIFNHHLLKQKSTCLHYGNDSMLVLW